VDNVLPYQELQDQLLTVKGINGLVLSAGGIIEVKPGRGYKSAVKGSSSEFPTSGILSLASIFGGVLFWQGLDGMNTSWKLRRLWRSVPPVSGVR
jgi:hypothetical protein